jgi:hypothetical protein
MKTLSEILNTIFSKFYNCSEHLPVDPLQKWQFSNNIFPTNTNISAKEYTNYATPLVI